MWQLVSQQDSCQPTFIGDIPLVLPLANLAEAANGSLAYFRELHRMPSHEATPILVLTFPICPQIELSKRAHQLACRPLQGHYLPSSQMPLQIGLHWRHARSDAALNSGRCLVVHPT